MWHWCVNLYQKNIGFGVKFDTHFGCHHSANASSSKSAANMTVMVRPLGPSHRSHTILSSSASNSRWHLAHSLVVIVSPILDSRSRSCHIVILGYDRRTPDRWMTASHSRICGLGMVRSCDLQLHHRRKRHIGQSCRSGQRGLRFALPDRCSHP